MNAAGSAVPTGRRATSPSAEKISERTVRSMSVHHRTRREAIGALILEFLLYYMTKPGAQLRVREEIYLDSSLDLF